MSDKRDIVGEYQQFCKKNCLAETMRTASYFAEHHLNKETKVNGQRIAKLYSYIQTGRDTRRRFRDV